MTGDGGSKQVRTIVNDQKLFLLSIVEAHDPQGL